MLKFCLMISLMYFQMNKLSYVFLNLFSTFIVLLDESNFSSNCVVWKGAWDGITSIRHLFVFCFGPLSAVLWLLCHPAAVPFPKLSHRLCLCALTLYRFLLLLQAGLHLKLHHTCTTKKGRAQINSCSLFRSPLQRFQVHNVLTHPCEK